MANASASLRCAACMTLRPAGGKTDTVAEEAGKGKKGKNKGKNKNTMSLNQLNGGAGGAAWGN